MYKKGDPVSWFICAQGSVVRGHWVKARFVRRANTKVVIELLDKEEAKKGLRTVNEGSVEPGHGRVNDFRNE